MIDGGILAGYLAVAAARMGGRVFDKTVDALFDRLAGCVSRQLSRSALDEIAADPRNSATQQQIGHDIELAASLDPEFAHELSELQTELDANVGRFLINQVRARTNVQAFGGGHAVGRDYHQYNVDVPDPTDISRAPAWARLFIVLGGLTGLVGLGIFWAGLLGFVWTDSLAFIGDVFGSMEGLGMTVSFAGLVLVFIGSVGKMVSRPRER